MVKPTLAVAAAAAVMRWEKSKTCVVPMECLTGFLAVASLGCVWRDQTACHRSCERVGWQLDGAKGLCVQLPKEAAYNQFQQCGNQSEQSLSGVWICAGLRKKGSTLCYCQVPACSAHPQANIAASPIASASCWLCKPTQQLEVSRKLERIIRQCFEIIRSTAAQTRWEPFSVEARNHLPSQKGSYCLGGGLWSLCPMLLGAEGWKLHLCKVCSSGVTQAVAGGAGGSEQLVFH